MLSDQDKEKLENMKRNMIIGNPREVGAGLKLLQLRYNADEIMIVTICHSPEDKRRSYELIAEVFTTNNVCN